jgi:hypothetical protein
MYAIQSIKVPEMKRAFYNTKIVQLIASNDTSTITREEIFNVFTGKGGLHGLKRDDYDSYHEFAEAKKEIENGQFFTPPALCLSIMQALQPPAGYTIADLTCGSGHFFNAVPDNCQCYGNELDKDSFIVAEHLYPNAEITNGDFIHYAPPVQLDMIVGNPPFNLLTRLGVSQHAYVMRSYDLLKFGGIMAIIVPVSYLSDNFHEHRKIEWINERFNFIGQCTLPADTFDADITTKLLILQKKGVTNSNNPYTPEQIRDFDPVAIYHEWMAPIHAQVRKDAPKLYLMTVQQDAANAQEQYLLKKKLYHIKANPVLNKKYYQKAIHQLHTLKTQKRPDDISDKEWNQRKLTPAKVLSYFTRILKHQNDLEPQKVLRVVKTSYGIHNKAYHKALEDMAWQQSVNEMLYTGEEVPASFDRLFKKKRIAYAVQSQPFPEMARSEQVDTFLNELTLVPAIPQGQLFPPDDAPTIRLNGLQKQDLGLLLQKRYGLLSWEQGSGKSVAGMACLHFWRPKVRNCFVIGPALAISGTWTEKLAMYGFDFIRLETITDVRSIKPGQVVIASFEILDKLRRFIREYVKRQSFKIALLVDESDELSNPNSKRTRAALHCFRKATYKVLTTGTATRNNITELYPQLELLYNNSFNMRCEAPVLYHQDEEGDIRESDNTETGQPFPAFRGSVAFKSAFCPVRKTVFGIQQETQDVYNEKELSKLISKTIITRSFQEVVGEKKHTVHTHTIAQQPAESSLYELLMNDFFKVVYDYYTSTGNTRKEAGLRLIRQITALIKASSVPHLMRNYSGDNTIGKHYKTYDLLDEWNDERVTVGCILKHAARDYYDRLTERYPQRKVLYIDGEMPPRKRKKVLEELQKSKNGILVCTQASLKSSLNIPYCNRVIIEALQWNIPKMSQFYFRFIRFDNLRHTEVHFMTYENTIEINLLGLLMAKERLNQFVKNRALIDSNDLYDSYDMDMNLLDRIITKEYDSEGKLYLRWGKQTFSNAS